MAGTSRDKAPCNFSLIVVSAVAQEELQALARQHELELRRLHEAHAHQLQQLRGQAEKQRTDTLAEAIRLTRCVPNALCLLT